MATADALSRTTDPDAFVYDQERVARRSTDFKAIAWLIGAALLAVAIGGALLWLRRRSVPAVVAPASPSSEPVTAKAPLLPPAKLGPAAGAPVPGSGKAEPAAATPKSAETPPSAPAAALPAAAVPPPVAPVPAAVAAAPPASIAAPPVSAPMPAPMPGTLDLNLLLSGMERALRQRVPRRIELRLSLLPVLWDCRTEVRAVQRLILDLVASAVADMRAGGSLVVGTRNFVMDEAAVAGVPNGRPGDYVRVTVRDSGPGMPQEALGRVLDPSGPRPKIAAAAERMKGLGGFVRVESAEAVGTAVHLYFPRVPEAAAEDAAAGGKPAVAEDAGADGGKPAPAEDATSGAKPEATEGVASGGKPAAAAE